MAYVILILNKKNTVNVTYMRAGKHFKSSYDAHSFQLAVEVLSDESCVSPWNIKSNGLQDRRVQRMNGSKGMTSLAK